MSPDFVVTSGVIVDPLLWLEGFCCNLADGRRMLDGSNRGGRIVAASNLSALSYRCSSSIVWTLACHVCPQSSCSLSYQSFDQYFSLTVNQPICLIRCLNIIFLLQQTSQFILSVDLFD